MEKIWLASNYYLDERLADMSAAEEQLFTRLLAFCGASETGGVVPVRCWLHVGLVRGKRHFKCLVQRGVIEELPDGRARFPAWDLWQSDGDDLVKLRKSARERKRRQRAREAEARDAESRDVSRDVTPTIKKNQEKNVSHVGRAAHVSNASAQPREPSTAFADGTPIPPEPGTAPPGARLAVIPGGALARPGDAAATLARLGAPPGTPRRVLDDLARAVAELLADPGVQRPDIEAGLAAWHSRTGIGAGLLRGLVADAAKARHGATAGPARATPGRSTTDDRVAAAQALKRPEWDDQPPPKELP